MLKAKRRKCVSCVAPRQTIHGHGRLPACCSAAALLQICLLLVGAGCAIDDRGLVRKTCYENEHAWVITLESWGMHLITNAVDGGLTVGRTEKTYFFRKPGSDNLADTDDMMALVDESALAPVSSETLVPPLKGLGTPIAFASRDAGVMLHANDSRTGVTIGLQSRTAVRLPRDFDGVLVMNFDSTDPRNNRFILKELDHEKSRLPLQHPDGDRLHDGMQESDASDLRP